MLHLRETRFICFSGFGVCHLAACEQYIFLVHLFIDGDTGRLHNMTVGESTPLSMGEQLSLLHAECCSFRFTAGRAIAVSHGSCVFSLLGTHLTTGHLLFQIMLQ